MSWKLCHTLECTLHCNTWWVSMMKNITMDKPYKWKTSSWMTLLTYQMMFNESYRHTGYVRIWQLINSHARITCIGCVCHWWMHNMGSYMGTCKSTKRTQATEAATYNLFLSLKWQVLVALPSPVQALMMWSGCREVHDKGAYTRNPVSIDGFLVIQGIISGKWGLSLLYK